MLRSMWHRTARLLKHRTGRCVDVLWFVCVRFRKLEYSIAAKLAILPIVLR